MRFSNRLMLLMAACCLARTASARAESFDLRPQRQPGSSARVELLLEVGGDLKVVHEQKVTPVPMTVVGSALYDEILLDVPTSSAGKARSARNYHKLEAQLQVDTERQDTTLREDRRTIGVEYADETTTYWNAVGPLSRDELDLLDVAGNSLLIDGLLPAQPMSVESTWQHEAALLAALLGLDAISDNDVTSILKEVTPEFARMELAGSVHGAIGGVSSEIEIKGKYKFDRNTARITWFALLIKEKRSIGHVGPGIDAVARLQMKITPLAEPDADLLAAAGEIRRDGFDDLLSLGYRASNGRFQFLYDRRWHIVNDEPDLVVLRRVDRGELVAQANATPLAPMTADNPVTLAKFQEDVKKALGSNFQQFTSASEQTARDGRRFYRVVAQGAAAELPVQWHYYLVFDQRGRQISLVFTLEQSLVEKMGDADQQLVSSIEFLDDAAESAAVPRTPTR